MRERSERRCLKGSGSRRVDKSLLRVNKWERKRGIVCEMDERKLGRGGVVRERSERWCPDGSDAGRVLA